MMYLIAASPAAVSAQGNKGDTVNPATWTRAYPPFRIVGNLYYVGSYELGSYLIAGKTGHILINTGVASSTEMIRANVEALGFKFSDIRILLTSQGHRDHVGAMAEVKKLTGARFMVDAGDSAVMADGGKSDYANVGFFTPVAVDRYLHNGDTVRLGESQLIMLHQPGHTKGSCSFVFTVKDQDKNYRILLANLPTIITRNKFSSLHDYYPGIAADYAASFASLKSLSFDIWLTPHAEQFGLHDKHKPGDPYRPAAFYDRRGYEEAVSELEKTYREKMAKE